MENTFENCTELVSLNLSPLSTKNLVNMKNIFSGCQKLETLNLTTFTKIDDNIFNDIQSLPNIIANDMLSYNISQIFLRLFSIKIRIIIEFSGQLKDCIIGENEKCKSCSKKIKSNCLTCNKGFYLPYYETVNKYCLPCNIEYCSSCFGEKHFTICSSCKNGYNLVDNKCQKVESENPICTIGEKEKCKTCNVNPNLRGQCETCNDGYYLPEDNKTICEKCDIEGCSECLGVTNYKLCSKCQDGYELKKNKCIKELCIIGEDEKCASCRNETGMEKVCPTCNDGYYIPENSYSFVCSKCSVKHCHKCSILFNKEICLECNSNFIESKSVSGTIEKCICPSGYRLINELCLENGNFIQMEYNVQIIL